MSGEKIIVPATTPSEQQQADAEVHERMHERMHEEASAEAIQEEATPVKKPRGFAAISPERRAEIASRGGKAAHAAGKAYRFTTESARAAGQKGGNAPHVSRGTQKPEPEGDK